MFQSQRRLAYTTACYSPKWKRDFGAKRTRVMQTTQQKLNSNTAVQINRSWSLSAARAVYCLQSVQIRMVDLFAAWTLRNHDSLDIVWGPAGDHRCPFSPWPRCLSFSAVAVDYTDLRATSRLMADSTGELSHQLLESYQDGFDRPSLPEETVYLQLTTATNLLQHAVFSIYHTST